MNLLPGADAGARHFAVWAGPGLIASATDKDPVRAATHAPLRRLAASGTWLRTPLINGIRMIERYAAASISPCR